MFGFRQLDDEEQRSRKEGTIQYFKLADLELLKRVPVGENILHFRFVFIFTAHAVCTLVRYFQYVLQRDKL